MPPSDGHDFLFFLFSHRINFSDELVSELLNVVIGTAGFVLGDLLILQELLHGVIRFTADIADRNLTFFRKTLRGGALR